MSQRFQCLFDAGMGSLPDSGAAIVPENERDPTVSGSADESWNR